MTLLNDVNKKKNITSKFIYNIKLKNIKNQLKKKFIYFASIYLLNGKTYIINIYDIFIKIKIYDRYMNAVNYYYYH